MYESPWIWILGKLAWLCQHVGIDLSVGLALASAAIGDMTGWSLRKIMPSAARLGWRAVSGTWRWAFSTLPLSPVAEAVLNRLESRAVQYGKDKDHWYRLRAPGGVAIRFEKGDSTRSIDELNVGEKDVLPLLTSHERKLVARLARAAIARIRQENDACTRMEVLDILDVCVSPPPTPSCTVATSGGAEPVKWDLTTPPPGVKTVGRRAG